MAADSIRNFVARFTADNSSLLKGTGQVDTALDRTAKGAQDAEKKVSRAASGISNSFKSFAGGLAAGLGAGAILDFGNDALKAASKAQQAMGGIDAVFKGSAGTVKQFASDAATAVGLSRSKYGELATVLGSQLKGMGQSTGDAAKGSDQLIKLGSDLAATYGGSVSDAVSAVSSLLKGERDPIEKYGVSLKQADIDAQTASKGLGKLTGAAKTQADAQSTLELLFGKTADAQGGFARESGTAANEAEKQAAKTENLKAAIGDKLLPAYEGLLGFINDKLLPGLDKVLEWFNNFTGWISQHSTLLLSLGAAFTVIAGGLAAVALQQEILAAGGMIAWIQKLVTSTGLWTAAQAALNIVMSLNPIGLVVLALAALGAALYIAWTQSETFRDVVTAAWEWVKNAASAAWDWIWEHAISPLITAFQWVMDKAGAFKDWLGEAWGAIATAAGLAWQAIKTYAIDPLVAALGWVVGKVTEFKDNFIAGLGILRDGVVGVFNDMKDRVGQVWDGVKELAKIPIRFVIDTVINDGLIGTYNTIASWFGVGPHDRIPLPPGFAGGGPIGGRSPNATADDKLIRATSGEYMQPVNAVNYYGKAFMDAVRSRRFPRFAAGGMVAPVPGPHAPWGSYPGHTGLDFPVGMGTPVVAALDGIVNAVKQMTTSYGIHVRMTHADGIESIYAHLESASASVGQMLKAGDQIGLSDSTGNSTGPHLHFELRRNGQAFDPTAMLNGAAAPPGGVGGLVGNLLRPLVDKVKDAANGAIDLIPGGVFGDLVKGMARKALEAVAGWLGAKADEAPTDNLGNPGAAGPGAQGWAGVASQALEMAGESQALLPLLLHRIDVESGGNPNAINNWDSNAKAGHPSQGLMQTIPSTFAAYAGALAGRGITDPLANIFAAIMYTKDRYGRNFGRAWGGNAGYAHGGLVALAGGGVVTRPTAALIGESGPEAVVPLGRIGNTYEIHITVERGASTAEVGRAVVDQIRAFEAAAGASWRAA